MTASRVRFMGVPGSPYTRKMLAYLRYRHIPYELLGPQQATAMGMPTARVSLLPTFYLPGERGELEAVVDSTPIIRRFEREFAGRPALPDDPALRFVDYLLEDYCDEWLTKAMFHFRWRYAPDIDMSGGVLPFWQDLAQSPEQHRSSKAAFAQRQISRLHVVGSNDATAATIEASYRRVLQILDTLLQQQPFLMGTRPGASDFACYAQLTQLTHFDPTPRAMCLAEAPRVFAWVDIMDDLSGTDAAVDWPSFADAGDALRALLTEVGRVYAPALLANAAALAAGETTFSTTIDDAHWEQQTFPYHGKCLLGIRHEFAGLERDAAKRVRQVLAGTGCEELIGAG